MDTKTDLVEQAIAALMAYAEKPSYRFLMPGELVERGDEVLMNEGWVDSVNWERQDKSQSDGLIYRRPIGTES